MSDIKNNSHVLPLSVQQKGKIVLSKIHPKTKDRNYIAMLESIVGAGNVIVLPHSDYLKYLGNQDLISVYSSENTDPLSQNIDNGGDISNLTPANIKLPPPTNLAVLSKQLDSATGKVAVTVKFNGVNAGNSKVTYKATAISPMQSSAVPFGIVTGISHVATYPQIRFNFNTVSDAKNYVGVLTKTDTKQTASAIAVPADAANTTSMTFTSLPHGSYNFSVAPYNDLGLAGTYVDYVNSNKVKVVITI